jgi:hypothetical protein
MITTGPSKPLGLNVFQGLPFVCKKKEKLMRVKK